MIFYQKLFDLLPKAYIDSDNDGQIVVYTNKREVARKANSGPLFIVDIDDSETN